MGAEQSQLELSQFLIFTLKQTVIMNESMLRSRSRLSQLETRSIRLLRSFAGEDLVEVAYSGGKDSDVILHLSGLAGIDFKPIHKCTTIDPPGTLSHCKEVGAEILRPKYTFFELMERKGMPTRRCRFCCQCLKEYKVMDKQIQGVRAAESAARAKRYKEPIICRIYGSKRNRAQVALPILDWSGEDIALFVKSNNIHLHPLYYDSNGNLDVSRRLGCMACPLPSGNGIGDYLIYPKLLRQTVKSLTKWWNKEREVPLRSSISFGTVHNLIFHNLFCSSYQQYEYKISEMSKYGISAKRYLEDYFNTEL